MYHAKADTPGVLLPAVKPPGSCCTETSIGTLISRSTQTSVVFLDSSRCLTEAALQFLMTHNRCYKKMVGMQMERLHTRAPKQLQTPDKAGSEPCHHVGNSAGGNMPCMQAVALARRGRCCCPCCALLRLLWLMLRKQTTVSVLILSSYQTSVVVAIVVVVVVDVLKDEADHDDDDDDHGCLIGR